MARASIEEAVRNPNPLDGEKFADASVKLMTAIEEAWAAGAEIQDIADAIHVALEKADAAPCCVLIELD